MKKQYISFSGCRKKNGTDEWETADIMINADSILSATLVDNRDKHPCMHCERRRECDAEYHDVPIEYECTKIADYLSDEVPVDRSFIEITTQNYVYEIVIGNHWGWYKEVFKRIKDRKQIDVDDYLEQKEKADKEKWEREHLQREVNRFKSRMRLRETCSRYCRAKKEDGSCYFGFKCVDGKPQEKCYVETAKRWVENRKDFIAKHILVGEVAE